MKKKIAGLMMAAMMVAAVPAFAAESDNAGNGGYGCYRDGGACPYQNGDRCGRGPHGHGGDCWNNQDSQ